MRKHVTVIFTVRGVVWCIHQLGVSICNCGNLGWDLAVFLASLLLNS
jgi:hypothetical protein